LSADADYLPVPTV